MERRDDQPEEVGEPTSGNAPAAQGVRMAWADVPAEIRQLVDETLGSPIISTIETKGGFSPGPAVVAQLADGSHAFVKGAGPEPTPIAPFIHRREAEILAQLPTSFPAPALLGSVEHEGWVVLIIEALAGAPPAQPWRRDELDRVLELVERLADAGTPCPIPDLPAVGREKPAEFAFNCWSRLNSGGVDEPDLEGLDPWARRNLAQLAELETAWEDVVVGTTLVHGDLRSDNIMLTADDAYAVDWPGAAVGPAWLDLAGMVPSIEMVGGPSCAELFDTHAVAADADQEAVTRYLVAISGYFIRSSLLPPPPGLPTLRPFQAAQGEVVVRWLQDRTGWR